LRTQDQGDAGALRVAAPYWPAMQAVGVVIKSRGTSCCDAVGTVACSSSRGRGKLRDAFLNQKWGMQLLVVRLRLDAFVLW